MLVIFIKSEKLSFIGGLMIPELKFEILIWIHKI